MIAEGEKFGLICLSRAGVHHELPPLLELPNGYIASTALPEKPDAHWREWLGSSRCEQLEEADIYFGCKAASKSPGVLDQENKDLEYKTLCFYWALFVSGNVRCHDKPMQFTGTMLEDGLNVRSVGSMTQPYWGPGTPLLGSRIDANRLVATAHLAEAIFQLYEVKHYMRFKRVIAAFISGLQAHQADVRLHQFVRCVEGFILPGIGKTQKQFKSRTELFVGPSFHEAMNELYELRSRTEHLHDALDYIQIGTREEKVLLLYQRAFEAEGLARYCISRLLERPALWSYFESDSALSGFWKLEPRRKNELWGEPLDFLALSREFEASHASRHV